MARSCFVGGQDSCGSEAGNHMKNVIISMIAKISRMDAEAKQLTARVEAQSLLLSALVLTLGKNGGVRHSDETDIGDELEFHENIPFFAIESLFGESRSAPDG